MELCSMNEAARALGMSYYEVYNLSSSGRIGRVKQGRRVFVPIADVQAVLAERGMIASPGLGQWQDVNACPDDRKDGRPVLLWVAGYPVLCIWDEGWRDPVGHLVTEATLFADVVGPGQ